MKNAWMVLSGILLAGLMVSCSGGNVATSAPQQTQPRTGIVGTWAWGSPSEPVYTKYEFSVDENFVKSFGPEGGKVVTFSGTYSVESAGRYRLTWAYDGKPVTLMCTASEDTLLFDEDKAKSGDPSHWTYHRVK